MDSGNEAARRSGRIPIHLLLTTEVAAPSQQQEAATSIPPKDPPISSPLPMSAAQSSQARSELAYTEYTPLQPRPYSGDTARADAASTSPPWSPTDPMSRRPRAPRPLYSEEQKFFIMYARIMRDQSWPEIEDRFAEIFGQRSKGGLTSVYYRARKDWGLAEVLKSGPGTFSADCREVELRAGNFSRAFLIQIGYLPPSS
ncbi:uncharacterized protein RCC_01053 [Ramularia collo-cygni]|uniref:Uncharacterized protein n=1 Tax=Ramularia collo-cygni TaxID=112498 RepID=A0A2D3UYD1_9PEZI|nr:uncharacterized protein RCC_01053 [Ramularia collo-cygni]CZT15164.1 uncharacterized protein RCC_01053 [Ramularia collo-cygni]